jgi:cytochrome c oxidase subunit II
MSLRTVVGRWPSRWMLLAVVAVAVLACARDYPQTTLLPRSDFAHLLDATFRKTVYLAAIVFVLVEGALLFAIWKFRARPGAPEPAQTHGNTTLEIVWTMIPAVILALIAVPTVRTIFRTATKPGPEALQVEVIGHQWWWEFRYPELGLVTASDVHLPAGRPVSLEISAVDVIHSFWVPGLGGKRDALPGGRTRIVLTAGTPGVYHGQCAEFCGESHANMRHLAIVDTPAEFEAWVAAQKAPAPTPPDGSPAADGLRVYRQANCLGCHRIAGVSAGAIGPDLTHFGSRRTIAGGILRNTPGELARWLTDSPAVKPGSLMPGQRLSAAEVTALVAYLTGLK